jgi:hypothetical protein
MPVRLFIVHHSKGLQMRTYYLQDMAAAYIEAAYFTDQEEGADAEFTREFEAAAYDACANFENACNLLEIDLRASYPDPTQLGHDLWYTRNDHGVGFWDRAELGECIGQALTNAAQTWPEVDTIVDEDGKIHIE